MTEGRRELQAEPVFISITQLKELFELINYAALNSRKEISQSKNGNAFEGEEVHREHFIVVLGGITEPNGSVYVENIYVNVGDVRTYINSCLTSLRAIRKNHHKFGTTAAPNGGLFAEVRDFDDFVKSNLAECYKQVTTEHPTMGGYKRTKGLGDQTLPARATESPFTQFALFMIELIGLRRLNGEKFTVNVLRNARSAKVGKTGDRDDSEAQPETRKLKAKPKGRPASDRDPRKLRDEHPIQVEDCSINDMQIINWRDRQSSKEQPGMPRNDQPEVRRR